MRIFSLACVRGETHNLPAVFFPSYLEHKKTVVVPSVPNGDRRLSVCNVCVGFGIALKLGIWQNKNPLKMSNYSIFWMFENPRKGRQARNFTTNILKILDLKSSSKQIFSEN